MYCFEHSLGENPYNKLHYINHKELFKVACLSLCISPEL